MTDRYMYLRNCRMICILLLIMSLIWPVASSQDFNLNAIIDIQDKEDVEMIRGELINCIFGPPGFPYDDLPDTVEKVYFDSVYSNLENLKDVENAPNYTFVKADIADAEAINRVFSEFPGTFCNTFQHLDLIIHFNTMQYC